MGIERLNAVFRDKSGEKVMSLFITAGFPELGCTPDLILELEKNGADVIELGMPFSDPLADGETIQKSSEVSIANGTTMDHIFDMVVQIRKNSQIPIVLMGYINPVLYYGVEAFVRKSADVGVDGFILPDVPIEEAGLVQDLCAEYNLALIHLVAPNTTDKRMVQIDEASQGFVYCVSVTGVTGAREGSTVAQSVDAFIDRVCTYITRNPVLVGFGIKSHEDAMKISDKTAGFVVGSALINHINSHYPNSDWVEQTGKFVRNIKTGK